MSRYYNKSIMNMSKIFTLLVFMQLYFKINKIF